MSAVALMGSTVEEDGTGGTQPWGTVMSHNVVREIGLLEKQSSALFLSRAALTRCESNLFFNGPRAFINFNDNLGGGNNVTSNGIWNTCRETGDHGPMNRCGARVLFFTLRPFFFLAYPLSPLSTPLPPPYDFFSMSSWDRQPFSSLISSGGRAPSFEPAPTDTHRNVINAGYGGSQAFECVFFPPPLSLFLGGWPTSRLPNTNPTPSPPLPPFARGSNDDGSAWYYTFDNFFIDSDGFKMVREPMSRSTPK